MDSHSTRHLPAAIKRFLPLDKLSPRLRRLLISLVGGLVLLAGIAMIFLPGPAVVMIPLGLAILASEFSWAQRWLHKGRGWFKRAGQRFKRGR